MNEKKRTAEVCSGFTGSRKALRKDDTTWTVSPVLADGYYHDIKKAPVYVAEITDQKCTSQLVKMLSEVFPLGKLQHLKRVQSHLVNGSRKLEIILTSCPEPYEDSIVNMRNLLPENATVTGLAEQVRVQLVAEEPPLTRKQYNESMKLWPTQFHEDKYLARVLNNKLFSEKELADMGKHMKLALTIQNATEANGAVVVDPVSNSVLITAVDCRDRHPLQHAVMVAIDLVAKSQGGGNWSLEVSPGTESVTESSGTTSDVAPYLCTGYDIYVGREPCTMCAMALVHSRIRRVFYNLPDSNGALGSKLKLHIQKGLNHHYEVWRLFQEKVQYEK